MPFFNRGRMQLNKMLFNSFGGSSGGDLFDGTYWCAPLKNNGADTVTDGSLTVTRLSPKNFETTSGEGVLLEGEATNLCENYNTKNLSLANINVQNGASLTIVPSDGSLEQAGFTLGDGSVYRLTSDPTQGASNCYPFGGTGTTSKTFSMQVWARVVQQGEQEVRLRFRNQGNPTGTLIQGSEWRKYTFTGDSQEGFNRTFQITCLGTGSTPTIVEWIGNQLEVGSNTTSLVEVQGSAATRNADTATVPTSNAFVDAECFLGNFNSGTAVKGVNLVTSTWCNSYSS